VSSRGEGRHDHGEGEASGALALGGIDQHVDGGGRDTQRAGDCYEVVQVP